MIEPHLPPAHGTGRPRSWPMREIVNGIFYVMRAGCPWRLLPSDLPPWGTIYRWFAKFRDDGLLSVDGPFSIPSSRVTANPSIRRMGLTLPILLTGCWPRLDRVHIFAHHTGTHIATDMAARYPDRVVSLGLNGIAYCTAEERAENLAKMKQPVPPDEDGEFVTSTFRVIKTLFPKFDPELIPLELIGGLRSHFTRQKSFVAVWGQDYPAALKAAQCPILATCAEDDMWAPVFDRVFEDCPDAKKVWLGKAMFLTPEYDAPRTAEVIREFLIDVEAA